MRVSKNAKPTLSEEEAADEHELEQTQVYLSGPGIERDEIVERAVSATRVYLWERRRSRGYEQALRDVCAEIEKLVVAAWQNDDIPEDHLRIIYEVAKKALPSR